MYVTSHKRPFVPSDYYVMYRQRTESVLWNVGKDHRQGNWSPNNYGSVTFRERFVVWGREFWRISSYLLISSPHCLALLSSAPSFLHLFFLLYCLLSLLILDHLFSISVYRLYSLFVLLFCIPFSYACICWHLERVPERIDDIDFHYNYTRGSQL